MESVAINKKKSPKRCLKLDPKLIKTKKQLTTLKRMSRNDKSTLVPLTGGQVSLIIRSRSPVLEKIRKFLKKSSYKPKTIKRSRNKKQSIIQM